MLVAATLAQVVGGTSAEGTLARFFAPWAHAYANSKLLATLVTFGHVAPLLLAGGLAVATDRATLRALRLAASERARHLEHLATVHRMVVGGIALSLVTGLLLFASDADTFLASWIFWLKMTMIVLLLANGYAMTSAERKLRVDGGHSVDAVNPADGAPADDPVDPVDVSPAWTRLRRSALASMVLWYAITLAGVALVNLS